MFQVALSELKHRRGRSLGLLLGILVATTAFTVLTGTSDSQRLEVRGAVAKSFRTQYDILVRPRGARTSLERDRGLVRPGVLTGIFGGISMRQWQEVLHSGGVAVAAPIATIGYTLPDALIPVDVTAEAAGASPALLRVRIERSTDRGLTRREDVPAYVWVTDKTLLPERGSGRVDDPANYAPRLETADGGSRAVCASGYQAWAPDGPFDLGVEGGWRSGGFRGNVQCWSRKTGLEGEGFGGLPRGHVGALIPFPVPIVLAAIDPEQEAKLVGLDRTILSGRYLRGGDRPTRSVVPAVPVLVANRSYADESMTATIERLPEAAARQLPAPVENRPRALVSNRLRAWLNGQRGRALRHVSFDATDALRYVSYVPNYWSLGPTRYRSDGATLVPQAVSNDPYEVWSGAGTSGFAIAPLSADDRQFRKIVPHRGATAAQIGQVYAGLRVVGRFDPARLPGFSDPAAAPLQTYETPALDGADAASRRALGGKPLLPNGNLGGYLTQPPLLLTNLRSLSRFRAPEYSPPLAPAPISAIRVRVAGVNGIDELSRERVRQVAQTIAARTGLDVDLTIGSSPSRQTIRLPAGEHGRPPLLLHEQWVRKGVGLLVLTALDRKSLILFVLILVACALFVANATSAAVRTRKTELGVLASLGWTGPQLFTVVLLEAGLVGLAAGVLGVGLSMPLTQLAGVDGSTSRALLSIPAALVLAVLAAAFPALRAARSSPIAAVRPAVLITRTARHPQGLRALAVANVLRTPGRSLLGAVSLAIGVCSLTILLGASLAFRGAVVGSLLGDAVSVQARPTDYVAVVAIVLLGVAGIADVLYLNIRERATELATLYATGWADSDLARLMTTEGTLIAGAGALAGGAAGLAATAVFAGSLPLGLVLTTVAAICGAMAVALIAALLSGLALRGLPIVPLLSAD